MSLAAEITEECQRIAKRREAARTLSSWALAELEAAQRPQPSVPVLVHRDPCPLCNTRGDVGCEHQPPSKPEVLIEGVTARPRLWGGRSC